MTKTTELVVKTGGVIAVVAGNRVSWRCMWCRDATRRATPEDGLLAMLDAWRDHLLVEHAYLLTDADRARLVPAGELQVLTLEEFEAHRTDCELIVKQDDRCTCRAPDGGT